MQHQMLTVELVPRSQWETNVRALVTSAQWQRCKKYAREQSCGVCAVCGGVGKRYPVDCHEQWEYDESGPTRVQRLVGLLALCPSCHQVKHFGRAQAHGRRGEALEQLMTVNAWTEQQAGAHIEEVRRVWRERSRHSWELDLTWLSHVLPAEQLPGPKPSLSPFRPSPTPSPRGPAGHGRARTDAPWSDEGDADNPFAPGTQEFEEHEMYMEMLAERD